ncbi:MAG: hypothetical protein NT154_09765, partial [Verrucomicrobia bacterium]|nr:hypothetical protein [Verrucomicrobiota bacterium]
HKLYFKQGLSGRLIAALNGYDWANKLADCMMIPNPYSKHFPFNRCNLDWFCEFCAYLKGQDLLKKYAGAWEPEAWHEMVISLVTGVCLADPERDDIGDVYDAMEAIIKRLKEEKHMQGYVGWLEIKVHSFWPSVLCTPHIHVLLRCDQPPDREVFERVIAEEWATWTPRAEPGLFNPQGWYLKLLRNTRLLSVPDLFLEPVKSEAHFYEVLHYIKPIDLFEPYHSGYQAARAAGQLERFHEEVRDFFYSLLAETTRFQQRWDNKTEQYKSMTVTRRRFLYGGNCHGSSSYPLGLKVAVRRTHEHQEAIRAKVELAKEVEERCRQAAESQPVE